MSSALLRLLVSSGFMLWSVAPLQQAPTLSGRVLTDGTSNQPVRHASVHVQKLDTGFSADVPERIAVTDDTGAFAFGPLPAGRYTVWATKNAWVSSWYGSKRPGDATGSMSIVVSEGQGLKPITLRMSRGAVITGTLFDQNGQPMPGARASVLQARLNFQTGVTTLVSVGMAELATADNRGVYRFYGLAPGTYVVMAEYAAAPFRLPSEAEWKWVDVPATSAATNAAIPDPSRTRRYAPIYFPGTASPSAAATITLAAGEERLGVDIRIEPIAVATITGTVQLSGTATARDVTVAIFDSVGRQIGAWRPNESGVFTIPNLAPGTYSLTARPIPAATSRFWATADVTIAGMDQSISLVLQSGVEVQGRVIFAPGRTPAPADLSRVRVTLVPAGPTVAGAAALTAMATASGEFTVGVAPGKYRLTAAVTGGGTTAVWMPSTALMQGRDALDMPVQVNAGEPTEAVVTFTDTVTALAGTLVDASGRPAPDYFVIAFPEDPSLWALGSRRIAAGRPGVDGKYRLTLPPGAYLLAAVTDVEQFQWFDEAFLNEIKPFGVKVALSDGLVTTQDLKIGSR